MQNFFLEQLDSYPEFTLTWSKSTFSLVRLSDQSRNALAQHHHFPYDIPICGVSWCSHKPRFHYIINNINIYHIVPNDQQYNANNKNNNSQ